MMDYLESGDFKSERFMVTSMLVVTSECSDFRYMSKISTDHDSLVQITISNDDVANHHTISNIKGMDRKQYKCPMPILTGVSWKSVGVIRWQVDTHRVRDLIPTLCRSRFGASEAFCTSSRGARYARDCREPVECGGCVLANGTILAHSLGKCELVGTDQSECQMVILPVLSCKCVGIIGSMGSK